MGEWVSVCVREREGSTGLSRVRRQTDDRRNDKPLVEVGHEEEVHRLGQTEVLLYYIKLCHIMAYDDY